MNLACIDSEKNLLDPSMRGNMKKVRDLGIECKLNTMVLDIKNRQRLCIMRTKNSLCLLIWQRE